jgi:peptidoglycan hydrolase CwlO-like protein
MEDLQNKINELSNELEVADAENEKLLNDIDDLIARVAELEGVLAEIRILSRDF